jgi:hypothetical protein
MASSSNNFVQLDYTLRDHEIVDYEFFTLPGVPGLQFRGPALDPDRTADFFSCIGAAQTMGIYIQKPFPQLLSQALGMPSLNLAMGAAWPGFFADRDDLIAQVNKGRFLILQVMSARGEPSSRYEATGAVEMLRDRKTSEVLHTGEAWRRVKLGSTEEIQQYLKEIRASWVDNYRHLLSKIKVPVILFWYSKREQDEPIDLHTTVMEKSMGEFPQFVDAACVRAVRELCDGYAECLSTRNTGHPLVSRFTGEPAVADFNVFGRGFDIKESVNFYYPSQEMHEDAVPPLRDAVAALAKKFPGIVPTAAGK